jgi:hypothetical protein
MEKNEGAITAKYLPRILDRIRELGINETQFRRRLRERGLAPSVMTRFFKHKMDIQAKNLQLILDEAGLSAEGDASLFRKDDDILLRKSDLKGHDYAWLESMIPVIKAGNIDLVEAILKAAAHQIESRDKTKEERSTYP